MRRSCKDLRPLLIQEAEPCIVTIQDDDDLNLVFNQLLICRLMPLLSIYVAAYYGLALNMSRRKRTAGSCDVAGLSSGTLERIWSDYRIKLDTVNKWVMLSFEEGIH